MRYVLLAALFLYGCPGDLEKQSHISKLRVLAVRADPAELILDGGTLPSTTLTALAVEPSGAPVSVAFALCEVLGGVPDATLDCPGSAGLDLDGGQLDLSDPRILALAASAQTDAGNIVPETLADGVPLIYGFKASSGAQVAQGFGTITLRTPEHGPANRNPELKALQLAIARSDTDVDLPFDLAAPVSVAPGAVTHLIPIPAEKDDPSERYLYSFFATAGEISSLHSTDITATGSPTPTWVQWTAPPTPMPVRFWVVVRDLKGGTAWLERSVTVQ